LIYYLNYKPDQHEWHAVQCKQQIESRDIQPKKYTFSQRVHTKNVNCTFLSIKNWWSYQREYQSADRRPDCAQLKAQKRKKWRWKLRQRLKQIKTKAGKEET